MTQAVEGPEPDATVSVAPSRRDQAVLSRSDQAVLSRRDRLRVATTEEIIQTARRLLVADGPDSVKLRAIAREMGMTAPGLYRYFGSREELLRRVCASLFTELGEGIGRAIHSVGPSDDDDSDVNAHMAAKMAAACQEFRRWSLDHKAEFALLFGVPLPGLDDEKHDFTDECALMFAGTFFTLFLELWGRAPFPVPEDGEIDPGLRDQLADYREALGTDIPLGAMLAFLRCWTLLYGAVSMEVFGHMSFALTDPEPMFQITLGDLAALVGLSYPPRR